MNFFSSFLRVTLIFTLGYSEQRLDLCQFSQPVFSIIFLRATIFSVKGKLHFRRFMLPKTCFGLVAAKLEASSFMSEKAAIQCFVGKHAALSFIAPKISFGQLATKLSFFQLYIARTSVFAFSWLQHVTLSFIAQKQMFGLFAVKLCVLCVLQWYCTGKRFSFSLQRVRLIFP